MVVRSRCLLLLACSLGTRFGTHAQFSKQGMLDQLVETLHRQKLQEGTLEAHHSILSAIWHLAGKPLQHDYQPSAAALACLQGVSTGVHGPSCAPNLLHTAIKWRKLAGVYVKCRGTTYVAMPPQCDGSCHGLQVTVRTTRAVRAVRSPTGMTWTVRLQAPICQTGRIAMRSQMHPKQTLQKTRGQASLRTQLHESTA